MKRWEVSLGVALLACGFAACTSKPVALRSPVPAAFDSSPIASTPGTVSSAKPAAPTPTITVVGLGETYAQPDSADAEFTISVQRQVLAAALAKAKSEVAALTQALNVVGIPSSDVAADNSNISIGNPSGPYGVQTNVHVEIQDLAGLPSIVGKATTALGPYLQYISISYRHDQTAALFAQARSTAMADAKARAVVLAKLWGRSLGTIQSISESVSQASSQPNGYYGGAQQSLKYTVNLTVVYALR